VGPALQQKGFKVVCTTTEEDFLKQLDSSDVAWIVSSDTHPSEQFLNAVKKYHESGRGLALWAENEPWTTTVNDILNILQPNVSNTVL
jgi:hypothetical protein